MATVTSDLNAVDLNEVWPGEASDFTPWLSQKEKLDLLGQTLGLDLEFVQTEKSVGGFKADIVCTADDGESVVLIENQLADTDHRHLGQTMTYAAGLDAVTIVWIAKRFRDEHRAVVDWLNEITSERFSFFGVEVKVWQIDDSRPAPEFYVVARPNDWTNNIIRTASGEASSTNLQHQRFWASLSEKLVTNGGKVRPQNPLARSWAFYSLGRASFGLRASRSHQKGQLQVAMRMYGAESLAHFKLLELEKQTVTSQLGRETEWVERQGGKECVIRTSKTGVPVTDENDWANQVDWFVENLGVFDNVFRPIVDNLDASEWTPDSDEIDDLDGQD